MKMGKKGNGKVEAWKSKYKLDVMKSKNKINGSNLRSIWLSAISCGLLIALKLFCWFEQLNDLKSLQTSIFQLIFAWILAAAFLQITSVHSAGGTWWIPHSSWEHPSRLWGIDGAADIRKRIGDATRREVTINVTPVSVILWNVVDVFRNFMQGPQKIQLRRCVPSWNEGKN